MDDLILNEVKYVEKQKKRYRNHKKPTLSDVPKRFMIILSNY